MELREASGLAGHRGSMVVAVIRFPHPPGVALLSFLGGILCYHNQGYTSTGTLDTGFGYPDRTFRKERLSVAIPQVLATCTARWIVPLSQVTVTRGIRKSGTAYALKAVERQKGRCIVNRQRCERNWKRSSERRRNGWNNCLEELPVEISARYKGLVGITWLKILGLYDSRGRGFHRLTFLNGDKKSSSTKVYAQLYSPFERASHFQMGELINETGHVH